MPTASLAHRAVGALPTDVVRREARTTSLGPRAGLEAIADRLYDGIEGDPPLRAKFGHDLDVERRRLGAFLTELLVEDGEPAWNRRYAFGELAGSHRFIHITAEDAARWLDHAHRAAVDVLGDDVAASALVAVLRPVADALVNEVEPQAPNARRESRYAPTRAAVAACTAGDLDALRSLLDAHPRLTDPLEPGSAELLLAASGKGRLAVVEELVARGIDVNKPARVGGLLLTAVCVARARRRGATPLVAALRTAGAVDDVFTSAYLGDVPALVAALDADPALLHEPDPASDFFAATVVDHAVLGQTSDVVLPLLVARGARSPAHGHQLLHHAAVAGRRRDVELLLAIGADATMVTPGRWVLHDGCARLLLGAGADVNHAPTPFQSWVWKACTGNQRNRDDPAYVRALLDAGADLDAVVFGRTALECAQRARFDGVVEVLRAAGAVSRPTPAGSRPRRARPG